MVGFFRYLNNTAPAFESPGDRTYFSSIHSESYIPPTKALGTPGNADDTHAILFTSKRLIDSETTNVEVNSIQTGVTQFLNSFPNRRLTIIFLPLSGHDLETDTTSDTDPMDDFTTAFQLDNPSYAGQVKFYMLAPANRQSGITLTNDIQHAREFRDFWEELITAGVGQNIWDITETIFKQRIAEPRVAL